MPYIYTIRGYRTFSEKLGLLKLAGKVLGKVNYVPFSCNEWLKLVNSCPKLVINIILWLINSFICLSVYCFIRLLITSEILSRNLSGLGDGLGTC